MAARVQVPLVVINSTTGNAVSGATVNITIRGGSTAATVYGSETGAAVSNPLTTDSIGRITAWLERGRYTLTISKTGMTTYTEAFDSSPGADGSVLTAWLGDGQVSKAKLHATEVQPLLPVTYSTGLPSGTSFADGQRIVIPSPDGVGKWAFYWGGSSDQYWYFTGGAPAAKSNKGLSQSNTSTSAGGGTAITNVNLTLPNTGKYIIETTAECNATSALNAGSLSGHGTSASDADSYFAEALVGATASLAGTISTRHVRDISTASQTISTYFRSRVSAGTTCKSGSLLITPIRLNPA